MWVFDVVIIVAIVGSLLGVHDLIVLGHVLVKFEQEVRIRYELHAIIYLFLLFILLILKLVILATSLQELFLTILPIIL